ncbi:NEDD8-activating enzyme E1 regulatory subunit [Phytophthora cactorum]|uniref:NEDD8-activating enzyme E1 regulatory subunit n=2 Tax=Phytophthora cactorum TaxID=29920 RepID=A0A329SIZ5_9STRA|nr:NEDD8-activating enzyme E1 regulatory subunit [Phytophthora cactorum]KAG2837373.1 NEDD8-activating enzyme E1 regulatory subunit [Phytophthora cactorum]KAG2838247.1 NEDD8-activating enzyme E1 regulatory subunit [Phytophthora cactorum]KAG2864230.1 NEDD8-activating enzyme E1 regulatory subunit [Phytophthora cactorum]KAG2919145.1 NEDD8-activating enzyme E1 regulatory subunit [Phytophthora cactorum]
MGDKYDRQLRLWGAEGQRRLANTRVLLAGSCATGSEALKNLVLPGVGRFSILDDANVSLADATNNFFVTADAVGQSRAETVAKLLLEMNADVAGDGRHANIKQVLQDEPQYLDQFDLVLATQLDEAATTKLAELCLAKRIPLLLVTSYGFLGSLRLQAAQHAIADAKLDPPRHELRLSTPFPTLRKFADSFALKSLSTIEHAHVPFVVLLLQAMKKWKEAHNGKPPATFPEKDALKKSLQEMAWGPAGHELNFIEAAENAYMAYVPPQIPEEVAPVLSAAAAHTVSVETLEKTKDTKEFWLLAHALADFVKQNDGLLPVTGVVPDMTASTESYVALQELYVNKAKEDATKVHEILRKRLRDLKLPEDSISFDAVAAFCKNAPNIGMLETRTVAQEYKHVDLSCVDLEDEDKEQSPLIWYFMLRAVAAFASEFNSYPGSEDATATQDRTWLVSKAKKLAAGSNVADWITDDHALEMTRSCQVELHNIAALMGGVAAQEAIKLITHQFEPLNHTYLFNGISGVAATYQL